MIEMSGQKSVEVISQIFFEVFATHCRLRHRALQNPRLQLSGRSWHWRHLASVQSASYRRQQFMANWASKCVLSHFDIGVWTNYALNVISQKILKIRTKHYCFFPAPLFSQSHSPVPRRVK
jgi:hypothetical protein